MNVLITTNTLLYLVLYSFYPKEMEPREQTDGRDIYASPKSMERNDMLSDEIEQSTHSSTILPSEQKEPGWESTQEAHGSAKVGQEKVVVLENGRIDTSRTPTHLVDM